MEAQLDNPVLLRIAGVEDKTTKLGDEVLILELENATEGTNIHLAHILYKPNTHQLEAENKGRIHKLVKFCQAFGISTSVATDTNTWIDKVGRANLDFFMDNYDKPLWQVHEFVPRNLDYTSKLTDEANWRGDRTRGDQL